MPVFTRVVVPLDGSACAESAVARAISLAADQNAEIHFIHVIERRLVREPMDETWRALNARGEALLNQAVAAACGQNVTATSAMLVTDGRRHPLAEQILAEAATHGADLIVCGAHGSGRLKGALLGRVAEALTCSCTISLLLERAAAEAETESVDLLSMGLAHPASQSSVDTLLAG